RAARQSADAPCCRGAPNAPDASMCASCRPCKSSSGVRTRGACSPRMHIERNAHDQQAGRLALHALIAIDRPLSSDVGHDVLAKVSMETNQAGGYSVTAWRPDAPKTARRPAQLRKLG